jgi:hypothetical protein
MLCILKPWRKAARNLLMKKRTSASQAEQRELLGTVNELVPAAEMCGKRWRGTGSAGEMWLRTKLTKKRSSGVFIQQPESPEQKPYTYST